MHRLRQSRAPILFTERKRQGAERVGVTSTVSDKPEEDLICCF